MESPIYIAISKQDVLSRQMDMIANNIANMNTTGYKLERSTFKSMVEGSGASQTKYVTDGTNYRDMSEGALTTTGNTYDLAIKGQGWFTIQGDNGQQEYTRAGDFSKDASNHLVTPEGSSVLDGNGSPITIPTDAHDIIINGDGSVMSNGNQIAKIGLVTFADESQMQAMGNSLYTTTQQATPVAKPQIVQGALESSNVQPILETTKMMDVLRSYQMAQNLVDDEHQRIESMISKLGQN